MTAVFRGKFKLVVMKNTVLDRLLFILFSPTESQHVCPTLDCLLWREKVYSCGRFVIKSKNKIVFFFFKVWTKPLLTLSPSTVSPDILKTVSHTYKCSKYTSMCTCLYYNGITIVYTCMHIKIALFSQS